MKNEFEICGNDVVIFVNGYDTVFECIVSNDDFDKVSSIDNRWYVSKRNGMYYVYYQPYIDGRRRTVQLHQFLMNTFEKKNVVIDHIDGDTMNNRRNNLQETTQLVNVRKAKVMKTNKLGVKHIRFRKDRNKYQFQLQREGKTLHLGYFDTLEEAVRFRDNYLKNE